jgi:hypothetical protein
VDNVPDLELRLAEESVIRLGGQEGRELAKLGVSGLPEFLVNLLGSLSLIRGERRPLHDYPP